MTFPPMNLQDSFLAGEEGTWFLMLFRKPCSGLSLYAIDADHEEFVRLRTDFQKRTEYTS